MCHFNSLLLNNRNTHKKPRNLNSWLHEYTFASNTKTMLKRRHVPRLRAPPVLPGASGMGRLVRVARVLRLIVHVSGRRWAGLTSPASSPRAALLADSSQLALALRDGFGGESQRQLEQVNLAPEGIYLGGRWGGCRRREAEGGEE